METITLPVQFLESVGNIALEVQRLVLRIMPFLCVLIFAFGFVSFLLGSSKGKLDFNKYLFTPIFLLLLVVNYPTIIDITGKFYGYIIYTIDKPEYKNFYLKYTKVEEELDGYKNYAEKEMKKLQDVLKETISQKKAIEEHEGNKYLTYTEEQKAIAKHVKEEMEAKLEAAKALDGGTTVSKIWDFFKLPTVRIIRYIIDLVRNVSLSLLVIVGCLAIMAESIPAFKGILNKWFKFYTAVTFWALTVCVLDGMFLSFAESGVASAKHFKENATVIGEYMKDNVKWIDNQISLSELTTTKIVGTDFALKWYAYGGSQGLNTAVSVVMVIFYCLVPFLTSLYIGGEQAGMFMSKVIGVGSMATQQMMQTGAGAVSSVGGATGAAAGGYKGSIIGQSVGTLAGSVGGVAGMVTSAGSGST